MDPDEPSNVLVTGGAGFIGRHLAQFLLDQGHDVMVVDDLSVPPLEPPVGEVQVKSVLDLTAEELAGFDLIYHLASHKSVPDSFVHTTRYLDNVDCARHLLRLATRAGVPRVIMASTCEVYGQAGTLPTPEGYPLAPLSPYACSKAAAELITRMYQAVHGTRTSLTIARLFNVFGPGERPDAVVPRFCQSALSGEPLTIEGTGTQRRDFSYVSDAVARLATLAAAPAVPVVNFGSGTSCSIWDLVGLIRNVHGTDRTRVRHAPPRVNEIAEFRADTRLQGRVAGGPAEPVSLARGVEITYAWWAERLAARRPAASPAELERGAVS